MTGVKASRGQPAFQGSGPDVLYHDYLAQGEFRIQRCDACGSHQFYPRMLCVACGSADWTFVPVSGKATVYSATTIQAKPEAGGPYNLSVIELAEGPRMFSRVEGIAPEAVTIGMAVRPRIDTSAETPFIVFDPV